MTYVLLTIFKAGVFRAMHFAPFWFAILIALAAILAMALANCRWL